MKAFSSALSSGALGELTNLHFSGNNVSKAGKEAIEAAASMRSISCSI